MRRSSLLIVWCLFVAALCVSAAFADVLVANTAATTPSSASPAGKEPFVALAEMKMMILPGTADYLQATINAAERDGAVALVVRLDTPGGMLQTSQEMIQTIFASPIPVIMYVAPSGATATSAGVFITLAGHVAAMAPGTSIGAAHPVNGDGKDIEGDMRTKAENMTVAMVKSIAEQRGRNVAWAEKSVKESSSLTENDALKMSVVDIVADDIHDLLKRVATREIKIKGEKRVLKDYSDLPVRRYEMSVRQRTINVFANPNVAALLWLAATTGLSLELYNPGAILPGVVGIICLILALAVSQIIPISATGILLIVVGAMLIGAEFFVTSGALGVGGVVAMVLGAIYLVDADQAPGLAVSLQFVIPAAIFLGGLMLTIVYAVIRSYRNPLTTGYDGLIGQHAKVMKNFTGKGKVFVNGEIWNAEADRGIFEKGSAVQIVSVREGLVLEVRQIESKE